ncbi:MAG: cytochrome c biogenesis protein DipZ, partial [Sphingomicrobium sp.]
KEATLAQAKGSGAQIPANIAAIKSPETYIGYWRADRFVSAGGLLRDQAKTYAPAPLKLNDWALEGRWLDQRQSARSLSAEAAIHYRFHARDLHLVLASTTGKPIRYRVLLDGQAPGGDAGIDVTPGGTGVVRDQRLYQLVRQNGGVRGRTFTIEFLDPGVEAFAFTFG